MDELKRIASYDFIEKLGCGGFATVYKCRDTTTGTIYAIKVSNDTVNEEYDERDRDVMAYMEEWNAYKALNFGKDAANRHGIPQVFETGIAEVTRSKRKYSYLVMQLLGKSLNTAIGRTGLAKGRLFEVAHAAIETLKYMHTAGYVHRDIKASRALTVPLRRCYGAQPANFCFGMGGDENRPPLYILDLGFACRAPTVASRSRASFVGTPDFASTNALRSVEQSYRDDMESLGYALLELSTGDLPWNLASTPSMRDGNWTEQNLNKMANRRERKWERLVRGKRIPLFIVTWVTHCKSLGMTEIPDYDYFHRLVEGHEHSLNTGPTKNKRKSCTSSESPRDDAWASPKKRLCRAEE